MGIPASAVAVLAMLALVERVRPWRGRPPRGPGPFELLAFLFLNVQVMAVLLGWLAAGLRAAGVAPRPALALDAWPLPVQVLLYVSIFDFLRYIVHRLMHAVPALWRLHRVHHRLEGLSWAAAFHAHPLELVVYRAATGLVAWLVGFSPAAIELAFAIELAWEMFVHADVALALPRLEWLLITPGLHRWHHARFERDERAVNYGTLLAVWDRLCGTAHPSGPEPARLGFPGVERFPSGVTDQLLSPWTVSESPPCDPGES